MQSDKILATALLLGLAPILAGCNTAGGGGAGGGGGGTTGPTGTLPVTGMGKALAFRAKSTNTSDVNTYTGLPQSSQQLAGTKILDKSAPGGIEFTASADANPDPDNYYKDKGALISASTTDTLEGGTQIAGMSKAEGAVYFENGNFGDPQVSDANSNLSAVGVYNNYKDGVFVEQLVLKHGTTIRYSEAVDGADEAVYAVGFIGDKTMNMPQSAKATYKAFHEGGVSQYDNGTEMAQMGLRGGTVELLADFDNGTVKGGIKDAQLLTYRDGSEVVLNNNITGLAIDANITGSEYAGTAQLVDTAGNGVGTTTYNESLGGFFGDGAAETMAAYVIEGNAELDGANRDYIMSGTFGGVKQ